MISNLISLSNPLAFTELTDENACVLCRHYKNSPYLLSDYSIGMKRMWRKVLNPSFAISSGCLLVKTTIRGEVGFEFPMPIAEDADVIAALLAMQDYSRENFFPFRLRAVPEECLPTLLSCYSRAVISYDRTYSDYLYETETLKTMAGRAYSGHRNHIKRFHTRYPGAVFRAFSREDIPAIRVFLKRFRATYAKDSRDADIELDFAEAMIDRVGSRCFLSGGFMMDGEVLSFCLSEICGDVMIDHIEKALTEFEGIYPATVQAFLQCFGTTHYFNREDDAADRGLRMSKLQYRPCRMLKKLTVLVNNELSSLFEVPTLFSERLSYTSITEADIDVYDHLCRDDNRNRFWGYDYRSSCENPERGYFYRDQMHDFERRLSLSFAIRYEGMMIGEAILHNFNCRGECEIGIRLLEAFEGQGFGRETLGTMIRYALYTLGLDRVHAKCYLENRASSHMLSSLMRKEGEDEQFEHYVATF